MIGDLGRLLSKVYNRSHLTYCLAHIETALRLTLNWQIARLVREGDELDPLSILGQIPEWKQTIPVSL